MSGVWRSAWMALGRKRLRTLLTISSIAIGTAMVVLVICIGGVGTQAIHNELESMGIDGLSVSSADGLTVSALASIRCLSAVRQAMPLSLQFAAAAVGNVEYSVVGCGIDSGADQVISLQLLHGRMLSSQDVAAQTSVCVVDEALAKEAFGRTNVVGQNLTLYYEDGTLETTVVGVSATGSSLLQNVTSLIPYMVYVPYTTQQSVTGVYSFDQIAVRLREGQEATAAEAAILRALERTGEEYGDLNTEDLATQRARLDSMANILSLILTAIGGVSLLVSGFGILTVMLSSVNERTREIGIKKAIGATRVRIMAEFLAGAFLMSFCGALVGFLVGCGVIGVGCMLFGLSPVFPIIRLLAVFALTLVLGTAFGAYPAYQAASLRPVEALRYEG
ncbi:MAG: ABC transporter permease [Clostridia bacterium]|nr:ABC transporter permease [Clostridia bacterium]